MKNTATKNTLPPGPNGLPIVGNALQFQRDPLGFVREMERTYGRMATIHIGKIPFVLCFRPEHVRYFLTEQQRNFTKLNQNGAPLLKNIRSGGCSISTNFSTTGPVASGFPRTAEFRRALLASRTWSYAGSSLANLADVRKGIDSTDA